MLDKLSIVVPWMITFLSVCISAYAVVQSKREKLTTAYYEKMTLAYDKYLEAFIVFYHNKTAQTRDALLVASYQAILYSSSTAAAAIVALTDEVTGGEMKNTDYMAQRLQYFLERAAQILHNDLARFSGRHKVSRKNRRTTN